MRLIHISDPHLSSLANVSRVTGKRRLGYRSWERKRRWRHRRAWLDALMRCVYEEQGDVLALTGDLVHIGLQSEVEEAAEWLAEVAVRVRVVLVPGNHDHYRDDSIDSVRELWRPYLHPDDCGLDGSLVRFHNADLTLLGLDTAVPTPWWSARGVVSEPQLDALNQPVGGRGFRVLMMHHPPVDGIVGWRKALQSAPQLRAFIASGEIDVVLHGHGHRDARYDVGGTPVFQTGSASSTPGSYRVFDLSPDDLRMQRKVVVDGAATLREDEIIARRHRA